MPSEMTMARTQSEPYKAFYAIEAAKELVANANEEADVGEYELSYENALNAMRMASAAVMFMDGCIISTLEGAVGYLKKKSMEIPADEWKDAEYKNQKSSGPLHAIAEAAGVLKSNRKTEAEEAVMTAMRFVVSAEKVIMAESNSAFEVSQRYE